MQFVWFNISIEITTSVFVAGKGFGVFFNWSFISFVAGEFFLTGVSPPYLMKKREIPVKLLK